MPLSRTEVDKLLRNALALQEGVMLDTRERIDSENLGFVYGKEAGEKSLRAILERIPTEEDLVSQACYLIRAIACSQIFNEGNKRMATVFVNFWLERSGYRLSGDPNRFALFMLRVVAKCPMIPLPQASLLVKDELYEFIQQWLEKAVVKLN